MSYKRFTGKYTNSRVDALEALAASDHGRTTRQIAAATGKNSIGGVTRTLNSLRDNAMVRGDLSPGGGAGRGSDRGIRPCLRR